MTRSLTFVVPAFNEEHNIAATVETIFGAIGNEWPDYEIVMINDASGDGTGAAMDALAAANPHIRVLHNTVNMNLGGAYKRGLEAATKDFVMMVPGDNGFDLDSLRTVLRSIGTADILIPYVTNTAIRTPLRSLASRAFTRLINALFGLNVRYYNGPVVHRTELLKTISIRTNGFAYQAEALVKLLTKGCSYTECPVQIQDRAVGRSSAMKLKNQFTILMTILNLLAEVGPRRMWVRMPTEQPPGPP